MARQVNEWGRLLSNEKRTDITKDDANVPRLLIGYQKDGFSNGSVGIKLSQVGVDVNAATSGQLIWSSDFNMFKIVQTGTVSITLPSGAATSFLTYTQDVSIPSYGTPPMMFGSITVGGVTAFLPFTIWLSPSGGTGQAGLYVQLSSQSGTLTVTTQYSTNGAGVPLLSPPTFTVRYYMVVETAATT